MMTWRKGEVKAEGYIGRDLYRVELAAPVYMNPRQKKQDDFRRQRRKKSYLYDEFQKKNERELPAESTVSYYI
ncbi:MAG: hypothetical protein ACI39Q_03915 [Wujia sp.]